MRKNKYPENLVVKDTKPTKEQIKQMEIINSIANTYGTVYAAIMVALIQQFGESICGLGFYPEHDKIVDNLHLTTEEYIKHIQMLELWGFVTIRRIDNEVDRYDINFDMLK